MNRYNIVTTIVTIVAEENSIPSVGAENKEGGGTATSRNERRRQGKEKKKSGNSNLIIETSQTAALIARPTSSDTLPNEGLHCTGIFNLIASDFDFYFK